MVCRHPPVCPRLTDALTPQAEDSRPRLLVVRGETQSVVDLPECLFWRPLGQKEFGVFHAASHAVGRQVHCPLQFEASDVDMAELEPRFAEIRMTQRMFGKLKTDLLQHGQGSFCPLCIQKPFCFHESASNPGTRGIEDFCLREISSGITRCG